MSRTDPDLWGKVSSYPSSFNCGLSGTGSQLVAEASGLGSKITHLELELKTPNTRPFVVAISPGLRYRGSRGHDSHRMLSFRTKTSDRWSDRLTPAGVLDMALRGNEEQWWELYHAARREPELRALLMRLLQRADPDLAGGRRLWQALLARMDSAAASSDMDS